MAFRDCSKPSDPCKAYPFYAEGLWVVWKGPHGHMGLVASKIENMKISVSVNPKGAMRSIMYVLDDSAEFG